MKKVYLGKSLIADTFVGKHRAEVTSLTLVSADYALVAGGGGGGAGGAGGGGGEVQTNFFGNPNLILIPRQTYWVTIGEGGSKGYAQTGSLVNEFNQGTGSNGENSFISSSYPAQGVMITALGGGGAGGYYKTNVTVGARSGSDGGSGGGSNVISGGLAIGTGYGNDAGGAAAGGGGGSLTTGSNGVYGSIAGKGGEPVIIDWIPYSNGEFGAGGGGGSNSTLGGSSFSANVGGGTTGGDGSSNSSIEGGSGSQFSGAGGGGGAQAGSFPFNVSNGGNGGSGFGAIRYVADTPLWTGGEISGSGGYIYHFFTASAEMSYIL